MLIVCGLLKQTRRSITQAPILQSFGPKKETIIQSDISMNGLDARLSRMKKTVCYASRALTEAESRYSNIERALLAAMWHLEHFNHYIEGNHVVLQTYHKPLVSIWMKPIHTASPIIQHSLLRMSRYSVKLEYIQGNTTVIADALSRMTLNNNHSSTPHNDTISIDKVLCSNVQISTTGIE